MNQTFHTGSRNYCVCQLARPRREQGFIDLIEEKFNEVAVFASLYVPDPDMKPVEITNCGQLIHYAAFCRTLLRLCA